MNNGLSHRPSHGRALRFIPWLMPVLLAACQNDQHSDLQRYIKEVKARPKGVIEQMPEFKMPEPFAFKPDTLRDPFRPVEQADQPFSNLIAVGAGPRPDFQRRKEELELFPLDALRMVGTVSMDNGLWALVKADGKTIHRVRVGNHMGKNFGKIIQITTDKIELVEIVPDKPGTWREQQTTIALAE